MIENPSDPPCVTNMCCPVRSVYPSFQDNPQGTFLVVTKNEFENADNEARKYLSHHCLSIRVDDPVYLENIDEFLNIIDLMKKIPKSPIAIRMLLMFDH